jgi:hypothetical protein
VSRSSNTPIEMERDGIVELNGGIEARHVIAATAAATGAARSNPTFRDLGEWHGPPVLADVDDRRLWVLFERDFLPLCVGLPVGRRTPTSASACCADGALAKKVSGPRLTRPTMRNPRPRARARTGACLVDPNPLRTAAVATRVRPRGRRGGSGRSDDRRRHRRRSNGNAAADAIATGATTRLVHRALGATCASHHSSKSSATPPAPRPRIRCRSQRLDAATSRWMWEDNQSVARHADRWHRGAFASSGAFPR